MVMLGSPPDAAERRFFVPAEYTARQTPEYFEDEVDDDVVHQPDVYAFVSRLAARAGCTTIIDVGCGRARKLVELGDRYRTIGVDFGSNIEFCRGNYPDSAWIELDLERMPLQIDRQMAASAAVVCSDVVEHLGDPTMLLQSISNLLQYSPFAVISTPDRSRCRPPGHAGPPDNLAHIREWTLEEFERLLEWAGLTILSIGRTRSNTASSERATLVAVVTGANSPKLEPAPDEFTVQAVMCAFNECDVVVPVVRRLLDQGVRVHVIDNWSEDETYERLEALGERALTLERFPSEGPVPTYAWIPLLLRVEEVAIRSECSWVLFQDADEIRQTPWPGASLRDGLWLVDRLGYTAVDHTVVEFHPVDDGFLDGTDPGAHFRFCEFSSKSGHDREVKAWKNLGQRVLLAETGGHEASFSLRRVFPFNFLLRHYPIRSQEHGERKLYRDRVPRWNQSERQMGWHVQYDDVDSRQSFLRDPAQLLEFDDTSFWTEYLIERLVRMTDPGAVLMAGRG